MKKTNRKLHNFDGPAITGENIKNRWYLCGKRLTKTKWTFYKENKGQYILFLFKYNAAYLKAKGTQK